MTIINGINKQAELRVTKSAMNYTRNRWEIEYTVTYSSIEPVSVLSSVNRTVVIANTPEQLDEEGVVIAPADNALDEFRDQIVSAGQFDNISEMAAIEHGQTIGIFVEYTDPTEETWEQENPTAPPVEETTPWEPNVFVATGMLRSYGGEVYRVRQSHTTQADWTPDIVPALFKLVPQDVSGGGYQVWVQPINGSEDFPLYPVGAIVHFPTLSDPLYVCIQGNAGNLNSFPPNVWGWQLYTP